MSSHYTFGKKVLNDCQGEWGGWAKSDVQVACANMRYQVERQS